MKFTTTRIEMDDLERLRLHAKANRRSMIQQLGQFIPPLTKNDAKRGLEHLLEDADREDKRK